MTNVVADESAPSAPSISELYGAAARSFVDFARTVTADEWATHCPCTPAWTARDVLSHVTGVPDDGIAGRTDGAATEPWTASQVERNAEFGVDELLDRFVGQYELFGAAIEAMDEARPPIDCHSHEHDIRQAIGRPGNRESPLMSAVARRLLASLDDVPVALRVDLGDGRSLTGGQPDGPAVTVAMSEFEIFRSRLGRRSARQVRSLPWQGGDEAIDQLLDVWFAFGPSELDIDED